MIADCRTIRSWFSERLDRRLDPQREAEVAVHLEACASCARTWEWYSRLFDAVLEVSMAEVTEPVPFAAPREAPGRADVRPVLPRRGLLVRFGSWRAAAAALLLLALSHLLVLEYAGRPRPLLLPQPDPVPASAPSTPPVVATGTRQASLTQRIRDHQEAIDVVAREIAYMKAESGEEGRDLVLAQMDALETEELLRDVEATGAGRGEVGAFAQQLLRRWLALAAELRGAPARSGPECVRGMQESLRRSDLVNPLMALRFLLASEAHGLSFREGPVAVRMVAAERGAPPRVAAFLQAQCHLLSGQYLQAGEAFEAFPVSHPGAPLAELAIYMAADSFRRAGFTLRVSELLPHIELASVADERFLAVDPLMAQGSWWVPVLRVEDPAWALLGRRARVEVDASRRIVRRLELDGGLDAGQAALLRLAFPQAAEAPGPGRLAGTVETLGAPDLPPRAVIRIVPPTTTRRESAPPPLPQAPPDR